MKILLSDLEYRAKTHPEYLEKILEKGKIFGNFVEISSVDYMMTNRQQVEKIRKTQVKSEPESEGMRPGDILASIIHKTTGIKPCKTCSKRQEQMNEWGWWGCWRNRKTIIKWMCEEAKKRGYDITSDSASGFFKTAFSEIFLQNIRPTRSSQEENHIFYKTKEGEKILKYVKNNLEMLEIDQDLIEQSDILPSHLDTFLAYWNTPVFVRSTKLLRRLFHSVVQIPKESRKFLRLKTTKEHPIEIDFPQTFPTLLLSLYDDPNCSEAEDYKTLLSSRTFYKYITQGKIPIPYVKGSFMKFLFSRHAEPESLIWILITDAFKRFPMLYNKIVEHRGPEFSVILQNLEAEICIASVIPKCIKENIFVIPIHDGYFVLEKDIQKIQEFLAEELDKRFGYVPILQRKNN